MIDNSTVEQARNADVVAFFEKCCGFTFAHRGGAYRCQQHPSLAVKNDRLSWYWHSKSVGGFGALDYLTKVDNMAFREAVEVITGVAPMPAPPPPRPEVLQPKMLVLPEKRGIPLRLFEYLCIKRSIDSEIVDGLMQQGKLYEDKRGNVVFIGFDEQGKPRFASLRGTYDDNAFRMDCAGSDKRYGFNMAACGASERLYIFESPIDAMSHASLVNADTGAWKQHHRLSLAGTADTALPFFLNQHPTVNELVFCLDNDAPGREAAAMLARKYASKGYRTRLELPEGKDLNADLQAVKREKSRLNRTIYQHQSVTI